MPESEHSSKYSPLFAYFKSLPADRKHIELSFSQLESILGFTLPPSACRHRPWWGNHYGNRATHWLSAGWKVDSVDLSAGSVVFVRDDQAGKARPAPVTPKSDTGIARMKRFFAQLPANQEQLALEFAELEQILGRPLSRTARENRTWWGNSKQNRRAATWLAAGWRVSRVYLAAQTVVFRRQRGTPSHEVPRYVDSLLGSRGPAAQVSPRTVASWVNFCARVGWYFEGVVLYEKSGVSFDALDDRERADLDEDYGNCKRKLSLYKLQPV